MTEQDRQEAIKNEDLFRDYEGLAFNCVECDSMVYVSPEEAECVVCGQMYDVEIDVTVGEKKERTGWPPDE